MRQANLIRLITEDHLQLNAILFGSLDATVGLIFLHALGAEVFSNNDFLPADNHYLSLYVHNRGHDDLTGILHLNPDTSEGYDWVPGGKAHEVFTECIYDIQAAVDFLKKKGITKIYLVGHSTGCQKVIYYLAQPGKQGQVKGVVLLCPMSDYASVAPTEKPEKLAAATEYAETLIRQGEPHALLPKNIWPDLLDAQRFLSLYTPGSAEDIFTYYQPDKPPEQLRKVTLPKLILIAEKDQYADRPTTEIAEWFSVQATAASVKLIKDSSHFMTNKDDEVRSLISGWLSMQS